METPAFRGGGHRPRAVESRAIGGRFSRRDGTRGSLEAASCSAMALTAADVKTKARALGFDLCGIAPAADLPELGFLREWLDAGHAGEMQYLQRTADRRSDVRAVMPAARSVIVFGTIYNTDRPYSTDVTDGAQAQIARYAWGDDYHVVIQARLDRMIEWLKAAVGESLEARAYVDTGPVQERVYAQHAGLGWIGKNTCVINADIGS